MSAMASEVTPTSQMSVEELVANSRPKVNNPPLPPPVRPARDAIARVAAVADQAPTPKPIERPAKPKGPTPDRTLRLGRGVHDAVRTIFPDKLHADLFSAFGRQRDILRGKKNVIPPDYEGLARQMGVSVKDVTRIASEYRLKVLQQAKALPEYAPEGSDVIDMEAPHWGGKTEMVQAAPTPPPVVEPPPVAAAIPEVAPEVAAANLKADLKALGAKPAKPKVAQTAKLPKSKSVRVTAVMDELTSLGTAEMQAISNDPAFSPLRKLLVSSPRRSSLLCRSGSRGWVARRLAL